MSVIYHTGLTKPPSVDIDGFEVYYYPVLKVEYESINVPQDISDFLQVKPIVLIMSKNAVTGLDKWLDNFGLEPVFFAGTDFWTVGDRTQAYLQRTLEIQSFYPEEMTGKGVLRALQEQNQSRILLISSQDPRKEFIEGLSLAGINYYHFSVYKTSCNENIEFSAHFKNDESNYLIITSPSTVDGILKSLSFSDLKKMKSRLISIGPTTSAAIRKNGGDVFLQSEAQNINALYENLGSLILELSHQ